jgi:hypothetical protein
MTTRRSFERDWKVFRELREVALDRLCARILGEATAVIEDSAKTNHERFLELYRLIVDRNQDIARGFNAPRRSVMLSQLLFIHHLGLLEVEELARFSASTRETIESLAKLE